MDRLRARRFVSFVFSVFSRGVSIIPIRRRRCRTFTIIDKNGPHLIGKSVGPIWRFVFGLLVVCGLRLGPGPHVPISSVGLGRSRESIKVVRRRRGFTFFPKTEVQETSGAVAGPRRVFEVFI